MDKCACGNQSIVSCRPPTEGRSATTALRLLPSNGTSVSSTLRSPLWLKRFQSPIRQKSNAKARKDTASKTGAQNRSDEAIRAENLRAADERAELLQQLDSDRTARLASEERQKIAIQQVRNERIAKELALERIAFLERQIAERATKIDIAGDTPTETKEAVAPAARRGTGHGSCGAGGQARNRSWRLWSGMLILRLKRSR